jgi:predicted nucleotidyltransferase component of viral defense system
MSKNLERSLKDRIKAIAKAQNRAFNDVWKALALERFLARLARSDKLENFIFKGGFLLGKYLRLGRETIDLDFSFTGTEGTVQAIRTLIEEILSMPYDDGFTFEGLEVQVMSHPHMNYPGYEVRTTACLGQTRTKIRMDLGIGDQVVPEKKTLPLLALNDKPLFESEISIQAYPLSYIFAEKMEAVVYRGGTNSRMKDFYDLIAVSQLAEFNPREHAEVVRSVFDHRSTPLPTALSYDSEAIETMSRNWKRFIGALEEEFQANVPAEFAAVIEKIELLLRSLSRDY